MSDKLPWYRWYPSDFMGSAHVQMMPPLARLAYRGLLDISWQIGPIIDPIIALESLGVSPDLWPHIRVCWTQTDEGWINQRLEAERDAAKTRSAMARHAVEAREARRGAPKPTPSGGSEKAASDRSSQRPSVRRSNQNQNQNQKKTPHKPPRRGAQFDPLDLVHTEAPAPVRKAWSDWVAHRREQRKPLTPRSASQCIERLAEWGQDKWVAAIEHSIAGGYRGLFPPPDEHPRLNGARATAKALAPPDSGRAYLEDPETLRKRQEAYQRLQEDRKRRGLPPLP